MAVNYDIPILFSENYISGLRELQNIGDDKIKSAYGASRNSIVGQARFSKKIPPINFPELKNYISKIHELKIRFHYTLNSPWSSFKERKTEYRTKIIDDLQTLVDIGVDAFIVANPYLISFIKNNLPDVEIIASINFQTVTAFKFLSLLDLGCKSVVLDRPINRNIAFLRKLQKYADNYSLIVNSTCLFDCPLQQYHANESGYFSSNNIEDIVDSNFCFNYCSYVMSEKPHYMLKSTWIRPEDITKYEEIGVRNFKIQGRTLEPDVLLRSIKAYLERKTPDNNLLYIFPDITKTYQLYDIFKNSEIDKLKFIDYFFNNEINCLNECLTCKHCKNTFDALKLADRHRTQVANPLCNNSGLSSIKSKS